jgi:hypothetical protein
MKHRHDVAWVWLFGRDVGVALREGEAGWLD